MQNLGNDFQSRLCQLEGETDAAFTDVDTQMERLRAQACAMDSTPTPFAACDTYSIVPSNVKANISDIEVRLN
eukprot:2609778-Pyramimonas_sp.AAC.1